jgi:hypothetical protein
MDIRAIEYVDVHWNELAQVRDQLRALVNMVMHLWTFQSLERNFVTGSATFRLSRIVLLDLADSLVTGLFIG